jgi:hypothetical protein
MALNAKQIKAKKRKRIKRNLLKKNQLKRLPKYPEIVLQKADASVSPEFVAAVRQIVNGIDLADPAQFPPSVRVFFQNLCRVGLSSSLTKATRFVEPALKHAKAIQLKCYLGDFIMDGLKNALQIEKYVPYNDFYIEYSGQNIIIRFDSLLSCYSKFGKIYYSRWKPQVNIEGKDYTVAFSRHAIERYRQRTVGDGYSYGGTGDAFMYLSYCNRYDHHSNEWNGKQKHYLSFYSDCLKGFFTGEFARRILEKDDVPNYSHACRMGYLPVRLWKGFACAATLLVPGMKGTPEQILLKNADIDETLKKRLIQSNQLKLSIRECIANDVIWVLKWYHDNGVSQVIRTGKRLIPEYI